MVCHVCKMAHLTSLLFAEDEEASVGQMAPPKDIWNVSRMEGIF